MQQRQERADAGRGERREDRDRVDVALVQHAQHDVDGDQRREDQERLVGQRRLERLRPCPGSRRRCSAGMPSSSLACVDRLHRLAQRGAGREVERDRDHRELPLVVDRQRRVGLLDARERAQRHHARRRRSGCRCRCRSSGRLLELRLHLQHDVVLVELREHRRDLPLPEGVVQRVVDHLRRDAQPRGGVAVDHQLGLQPLVLLVAGDVAQLRQRLQLVDELAAPSRQFLGVRVFQAVLELRAADAVFDRQVLHRLHEQRDALDLGQLRLEPADHVAGVDLPLLERLEVDLDAAAVERGVGAVDADERREALDRRVLQDHLRQLLLPLGHGVEGDRLRRFGDAQDHAGVLHREEALGDDRRRARWSPPAWRRRPAAW